MLVSLALEHVIKVSDYRETFGLKVKTEALHTVHSKIEEGG